MTTPTLASGDTTGFGGKSTSVAFNIVLCAKIDAWLWLLPNGYI